VLPLDASRISAVDISDVRLFPVSEDTSHADADLPRKHDAKNSRRKMDKPRKRKRACTSVAFVPAGGGEDKIQKVAVTETGLEVGGKHVGKRNSGDPEAKRDTSRKLTSMVVDANISRHTASAKAADVERRTTTTPYPEDLSTVRLASSPSNSTTHQQQTDSSSRLMTSLHSDWTTAATGQQSGLSQYGGGGDSMTGCSKAGPGGLTSSVLDLEEAMNKHLPVPLPGNHHEDQVNTYGHHHQPGMQKHQTIQWIGCNGGNADSSTRSGGLTGNGLSSDMSAASLLRSLYPNRESVIRTNVYGSRLAAGMSSSGVVSSSQAAAAQYYSNMQNALLTPPGGGGCNELYKDSFAASLLNHSRVSNGYALMNSSYSTSNGGGAPPTLSMADAYAITPPSSVSPQEGHSFLVDHLISSSTSERDTTAAAMMQGYCGLPIRPHAYSLSASGAGGYDQQVAMAQYQGYYSASNLSSPYNCMSGASSAAAAESHYHDSMKNGW